MNGSRAQAAGLVGDFASRAATAPPACDVLLCPPVTLLAEATAAIDGAPLLLGAQDCHTEVSGAHTGDVSAEMLADAGCAYVIVGHSERRADHGEADALIRAKASAVHHAGLSAIVCVGESAAERDAGQAFAVVATQARGSLPETATAENTVLAYEPVWAIGTGRTPSAADVGAMHNHLRAAIADDHRILYGGSVKADNASVLMAVEGVDGALVGGASLDAESFWAIVTALDGAKAG